MTISVAGTGTRSRLAVALLVALSCGCSEPDLEPDLAPEGPARTAIPSPRHDALFQHRHEAMRARSGREEVGLVFLGDSILRRFETDGRDAWQTHYAGRRAANFAIEGDRTQHVLWRIEDGLFAGMTPELIVLEIGTNNALESGAHEIAAGVRAIVDALGARLPDTRVLVVGLLPRGQWLPGHPMRERIESTNAMLSAWVADRPADGRVEFVDVGRGFLARDGGLDPTLMPDGLHPGAEGYAVLANALEPVLQRILGDRS